MKKFWFVAAIMAAFLFAACGEGVDNSNLQPSNVTVVTIDKDLDGDLVPDDGCGGAGEPACDNCPDKKNPLQEDTDEDGGGDACDQDDDNDGWGDEMDNCPLVSNLNQADAEDDGLGDACDPDMDNDGVMNDADNCPLVANPGQEDADSNDEGDACTDDADGDGVLNDLDNCPLVSNPGQEDLDGDDDGDACDPDMDGDGDPNTTDCATTDPDRFVGQVEICDGIDNNCDSQVDENSPDSDGDGTHDCIEPDTDGDSVIDDVDNCPDYANAGQEDDDADGIGDICDPDCDGDNIPDGFPFPSPACIPDVLDLDDDGYCPNGQDLNGDGDCLDEGETGLPDDCLEGNATINPAADEICDGIDNNCDGQVDEGGNTLCDPDQICQGVDGCISDPTCIPDCDGRECGDDGCGGECGTCTSPETCNEGTGECEPECAEDADCDDNNVATVDACVDDACEYCTPNCTDRECGDDGCGGECGTCGDGELCDATYQCVEPPQAGALSIVYAVDRAAVPAGVNELRLLLECNSGTTVVIPWRAYEILTPLPSSGPIALSYEAEQVGISSCKINVVGMPGQVWMARCDGLGDCSSTGTVSYSYYTGMESFQVSKVGEADNGQGGANWFCAPGTDNDGDGILNADDADPNDPAVQ